MENINEWFVIGFFKKRFKNDLPQLQVSLEKTQAQESKELVKILYGIFKHNF